MLSNSAGSILFEDPEPNSAVTVSRFSVARVSPKPIRSAGCTDHLSVFEWTLPDAPAIARGRFRGAFAWLVTVIPFNILIIKGDVTT